MKSFIRTVLAIIIGFVIGSLVNMGIITASPSIIPPPAGVDLSTVEGINAALPLLQPWHFLMPFIAHALGTFTGACIASLLFHNNSFVCAMSIAVLMLCGGVAATIMIPAPVWFIVIDLILAYIPMGWLGWKLTNTIRLNLL